MASPCRRLFAFESFLYTLPAEDMMAASRALLKTQVSQQLAQIVKPDVRVRGAPAVFAEGVYRIDPLA